MCLAYLEWNLLDDSKKNLQSIIDRCVEEYDIENSSCLILEFIVYRI